jgi:hypothetical protein
MIMGPSDEEWERTHPKARERREREEAAARGACDESGHAQAGHESEM